LRGVQNAKIRQQAADLIARIAVVMKACDEEKLLGHLGVVLYEYLGEEYPEVLGSILAALKVRLVHSIPHVALDPCPYRAASCPSEVCDMSIAACVWHGTPHQHPALAGC
jgi:hypothetical protein